MPQPLSVTENEKSVPSRQHFMETTLPSGAKLTAFVRILMRICFNAAGLRSGAELGRGSNLQRHAALLEPIGHLHGDIVEQVAQIDL